MGMMSDVDSSREEIYGMLARLFLRPPDEALVRSLLGENASLDAETVAVEFTELLRGIRQTSPPPPYESLYREGVIQGQTTQKVIEAYHAFGVHPTETLDGEPADHISLELDFMRHLVTLEDSAATEEELRKILQAEDEFLGEHLCQWVAGLHERIQVQDGTGFYSSVASFTDEWVVDDRRRLQLRLNTGEVAP
jgi:TorA maturation chaperone TorD